MMIAGHFSIFVAWVTYYTLHSILASEKIKSKLIKNQFNLHTWRKIYSTISILGLIVIFYLMAISTDRLFWDSNSFMKLISMIFTTYGLILIKVSFKNRSLAEFLTKELTERLAKTNIYQKVRHPLYSATLLIMTGLFLFIPKTNTLIALGTTAGYLIIGIYLEEKKLIKKFGEEYKVYKKNVPALFPKFW